MSFSDDDGDQAANLNDVFGDSDESDNLDISGVANLAASHTHKDIQVTEDNHFKVSQFASKIPEKTHLMRLPAAFGIQTVPYDKNKYSEEDELNELADKKRISRSEALIRWRWKRDSDGNIIHDARGKPVRESNARIVRWSDGSYQLLIGDKNVINLALEDNSINAQYLAVTEKATNTETSNEEDFLHIQSHLNSRIRFNPRYMAPVPASVQAKENNTLNYVMNPPLKNIKARKPGIRNHAVKDKEMDRDFLVNDYDEDDEMNLANIKEMGRSGNFKDSTGYDDYLYEGEE